MSTLAFVVGVVAMAVGIALSIALHEIGHLVPAKRFGLRVPQYMVGFGPTIWSRRRGETEYGVKAVPLGGYIRMIGMFPPRPGDPEGVLRASSTGRFSQLVDEARAASLEEIRPGDEHRVFYKLPVHRKVVIMLGGPVMNLLIAVVLLTLLVTVHGVPTPQPGAVVASVSQCVVPVTDAQTTTSCAGKQPTPALAAGIRPDDRIVSIDGTAVTSPAEVGKLIRPAAGSTVPVVVERDGRQLTLSVKPIRNSLPVLDAQGNPVVDSNGTMRTTEAGFLGVSTSSPEAYVPQSIGVVPGYLWQGVSRTAVALVDIPHRMVGVWNAAFGGQERDINGPMSVVGVGRVAGEASSGKLAQLTGGSVGDRFWFLVSLLATLNLFLFLFNLIPLLPLDGGHVAGALWEGLKRWWAGVRGAPDPGYVDVAKALPVAYSVGILLVGMSALLIYADVVNPVNLGG